METVAKIYIRDNSDRHWERFGEKVVIANLFQDNNKYIGGYSGSSLKEVESWLKNEKISHSTYINVQNLSVAPNGEVYSCN